MHVPASITVQRVRRGAVVVCAAVLAACSGGERLHAVPPEMYDSAEVVGMPGVRYSAGDMPELVQEMIESVGRERDAMKAAGDKGPLHPVNFLALSGGGDKGAFGAGILVGWTKAGTRPEFKIVTGVSTGALIAPFAFLGPSHDSALQDIYTHISTKDILTKRFPYALVFDDAMADNAPLWALMKKHVDEAMLRDIAAEYKKGRLLIIGTTNLDKMHGTLWNIGKIAASGNPNSLHLIQSILIASAAIPGAFPPVLIDVEAGGKKYQEMHVDGGTIAQVFVYPTNLKLHEVMAAAGIVRERHMYIIRNARLDPDWMEVERKVLSIAERSVTALIQEQGRGDLFRIHSVALRDHVDFNLAYIPASFNEPHPDDFDTGFMRALYKFGYDQAVAGYPWAKAPPGY
jgi:predicted acylesterase/phospholipase RssA